MALSLIFVSKLNLGGGGAEVNIKFEMWVSLSRKSSVAIPPLLVFTFSYHMGFSIHERNDLDI